MNTISNLLQEYLVLQKSLSLPQIGTLQIQYHPAKFDLKNKTLNAYRYELVLLQKEDEENQKKLMSFLQHNFYEKANPEQAYYSFVQEILNKLKTSVFVWGNIGIFKMNQFKKVFFEPNQDIFKILYGNYIVPSIKTIIEETATLQRSAPQRVATNIEIENPTPQSQTQEDVVKQSDSRFNRYRLNNPISEHSVPRMFVDSNHSKSIRTEFLETELAERYNAFQKISIIVVLAIVVLYLFFHLFLNDFSFHSYSN